MTKKTGTSIVVSGKRSPTKPVRTATVISPLVPTIIPPEGAIAQDEGTTLIAGRPYLAHGVEVPAIETYYVDGLKPRSQGAWLGEADKVAWRDEATGYECIMLRNSTGGHLCGYVGVPNSHPLYGFEDDAISPEFGIEVHGGITYAQICKDGPTPQRRIVVEARRICHVPLSPIRHHATTHGSDYRIQGAHVWWFGFECDHIGDVVPNDPHHRTRAAAVGVAQVYRDDAYVFAEVSNLAAQLHAVAEGLPMPPRQGGPLPDIAIDPRRGR